MDTTTAAVRRTLGVLLLLTSFATVACSSSGAESSASVPIVQAVPEGQFTAEFPRPPVRQENRVTVSGVDLVIVTYKTDTASESVAVAYVDYPEEALAPNALDGAAEGSAANVGGTIESKTETTFMGHPTMDVVIKVPQGFAHERLILRGTRLYNLIGAGPSRPASYDRLVETFVLN